MLSADDADLCRRDPGLPGLALLLDTQALVETLHRSAPAVDVRNARATYLRYKPGLSCLAAYALDVAGGEVLVHAHACTAADWQKYSKLTGPDEVPGPLGPGRLMWPAQGVLISTFPNDRKLKALRRLADPDGLSRVLSHFDPIGDPARATLSVLAYKPERRLVARVETDGRPWAVLRVYTESAYERALENARAFHSAGRLRVARPLGRSRWQQVLGTEFLPGRTLDSSIGGGGGGGGGGEDYPGPAIVAPVGEALAELHAQTDAGVRAADPAKAAGALAELADWVGFLCPCVAGPSRALAAELAAALAQHPTETCPTHGDFYASQVLLDGGGDDRGRVGLLDLDEACAGEPWADLGNFAAHLESDAIRGHVPGERVGPIVETLDASYCEAAARRRCSPRVALHTAAALFRLAPHPFRRREANWPTLTSRVVRRAGELLELYRGGP